jgi:YihY family inner membrane protein
MNAQQGRSDASVFGLSPEDASPGFWIRQAGFWKLCLRRLGKRQFAAYSSALSFRTIFAMVPILVLAILIMKSVGLVEEGKKSLRAFLERSGFEEISLVQHSETAPASQDGGATSQPAEASAEEPASKTINVANQIEEVVSGVEQKINVRALGPIGIVLLVWTALTLLITMEESLNRIFGINARRGFWRRVTLYWFVLTLVPILLGATVFVLSKVADICYSMPVVGPLMQQAEWIGPILMGVLLLTAVYKLMPFTNVAFTAALTGAIVAVPVWAVAKWGFSIYVHEVVAQKSLYGAMGLLPLFLIWLNLSWTIFLLGAEITHTSNSLRWLSAYKGAERPGRSPWDTLAAAMAVAAAFASGAGAAPMKKIVRELGLPLSAVQGLLDRLVAAGVLLRADAGNEPAYTLARPAENISVLELLCIGETGVEPGAPVYASALAGRISGVQNRTREDWGALSLADTMK